MSEIPDDPFSIILNMLGNDIITVYRAYPCRKIIYTCLQEKAKRISDKISVEDYIWICEHSISSYEVTKYSARINFGIKAHELRKLDNIREWVNITVDGKEVNTFQTLYWLKDVVEVCLRKYKSISKLLEHNKNMAIKKRIALKKNREYKRIILSNKRRRLM